MTITASVAFFGKYRPAYFEADTVGGAVRKAVLAIASVSEPRWFVDRLIECEKGLADGSTHSVSIEHGGRAVTLCRRAHDPWLDSVTAKMPAFPGLDYSESR